LLLLEPFSYAEDKEKNNLDSHNTAHNYSEISHILTHGSSIFSNVRVPINVSFSHYGF